MGNWVNGEMGKWGVGGNSFSIPLVETNGNSYPAGNFHSLLVCSLESFDEK
jgi:hypothetical protein